MFNYLLALLEIGTIGFYTLVLGLSIIFTMSTLKDTYGWAILSSILAFAIYYNDITAITINWQMLIVGIISYGLIGSMWSLLKWYKFCGEYIKNMPVKAFPWSSFYTQLSVRTPNMKTLLFCQMF